MKPNTTASVIGAVLAAGLALPATAADMLYEQPPVVTAPPPQVIVDDGGDYGGWYIRGDLDYAMMSLRGAYYHTNAWDQVDFTTASIGNTYSIGAGVGYKAGKYLRMDLTGDYEFSTKFLGSTTGDCTVTQTEPGSCNSVDTAKVSVFELMANVYADLGTYHGITPYVGAGIGGAYVAWSNLTNVATCTSTGGNCDTTYTGYNGTGNNGSYTMVHGGEAGFRFAYALMAGASYDLTHNLAVDLGYRYKRIIGGKMFKYLGSGTQGYDKGIDLHQVRLGLRYKFGGSEPVVETVTAPPEVYTEPPVYK